MKNYTTSVNYVKTVAEIEKLLIQYGASKIMKGYENGVLESMTFSITTNEGEMAFKLPCEYLRVSQRLKELKYKNKLPGISNNQARSIPHALNVSWRILKDWLHAQLSLIDINMVSLDQIFLPYAWDGKTTLYQNLKEGGFKLLQGVGV